MTSNIGSQFLTQKQAENYDNTQKTVLAELRKYFRPEFLNRVDEIVVFHNLTKDHLVGIVEIQLHLFEQKLAQQKISLSIDNQAKELLAEEGFDPVYGARPLKRQFKKNLRLLFQGCLLKEISLRGVR